MDQELLVEDRIDDGRSLIARLPEGGVDVAVAFWARTDEDGSWQLYIGSASLDAMDRGHAYHAVYAVLRRISSSSIGNADINIIDSGGPIARDAIAVRDRYSARLATRYRGRRFGDLPIEEAYIYPRVGVLTRKEVLQTVTGLLDRTGAVAPSRVTLHDGTQFEAVPVGIQARVPGDIRITFHDLGAGTDRSVPVDDVVGIL